jgi:predicted DNA-binding transcriptional regulator YafY
MTLTIILADYLPGRVTVVDRIKKTERLLNIWLLLASKQSGYTAKELASRFDVDERTIYRDFTDLGLELSVPVYNDKKQWKMDEKRFLPPIRFTLTEALNIFLTSRLMLAYAQRYDPNLDATFTKLSSVLPDPLAEQVRKTMDWMQKLPKDQKYLGIIAKVAEAWVSRKRVKILYQNPDSKKPMERLVDVYYIEPAAPGHTSYVLGYCHLKQALRTFKIERIESIEITGEGYSIPEDFDANKYYSLAWGIVAEGDEVTVRLKFSRGVATLIGETIWHPSQTIEKQKDGSLIMTLNVLYTYELVTWILGWGAKVEVLEPAELREEIQKTAKAMVKVY